MIQPEVRNPILLSIAAAVLTMGLKATAYLITGSVGLFADALESGVNLLAAVTAYLSLWYAARPADPNHTYGHEKIEFFSSGMEGVLVLLAGLGTAGYAVRQLLTPADLTRLDLGVGLTVLASVVNLAVARVLLRAGRRHGSLVLEADGHHLMTDVITSLAVIAGLLLVWLTGVRELDSLVALLVGLHIAGTGLMLVRRSFDGLMDHALPEAEQTVIREAIRAALPAGAEFHHLRTRQAGRRKFADFHLLVEGSTTVRDAHVLTHKVEDHLLSVLPALEVTIHVEPVEEPESWESDQLARLGEPPVPPGN